jgi:protein involved in polysaccharide export with SLBB domain
VKKIRLTLFFALVLCVQTFAQLVSPRGLAAVPLGEIRQAPSLQPIQIENPIDDSYLIGPGDFFEIYVEDRNIVVQVSPEVSIVIEEVGSVDLRSKTLGEAKKLILEKVALKYDPARCFVHLVQIKNFMIPIYGAITAPGSYQIPAGSRLSSLIIKAGGIIISGNEEEIQIIRASGDTLKINYFLAEQKGDKSHDPVLLQGDRIYVPLIDFSKDLVFVRTPNGLTPVQWQEGKTVYDYMMTVGVFRNPYNNISFQVSTTAGAPTAYPFAEAINLVPKPGSIIEPLKEMTFVYVGGSMLRPGALMYNPDYKPIDYLVEAGLSPVSGNFHQLTVVRMDGKVENVDPINGKIYPGDYLELPKAYFESVKEITGFLGSLAILLLSLFAINYYLDNGYQP